MRSPKHAFAHPHTHLRACAHTHISKYPGRKKDVSCEIWMDDRHVALSGDEARNLDIIKEHAQDRGYGFSEATWAIAERQKRSGRKARSDFASLS